MNISLVIYPFNKDKYIISGGLQTEKEKRTDLEQSGTMINVSFATNNKRLDKRSRNSQKVDVDFTLQITLSLKYSTGNISEEYYYNKEETYLNELLGQIESTLLQNDHLLIEEDMHSPEIGGDGAYVNNELGETIAYVDVTLKGTIPKT